MSQSTDRLTLGLTGNITVPTTLLVAGDFCEILCLGATAFTVLTDSLEQSSLNYGSHATGTHTFSTGALTANDTLTVAGQVFTAVAENATPTAIQFKIGTTYATAAANALAAISAHAATTAQVTLASAAGASDVVITYTAKVRGTGGNALTLAKSAANVAVSGSGTLTGAVNLVPASTPGTPATYPAGTVLRGHFTAVQPSAASVRCYLSPTAQ